ncbi:hypothetical protein GCM10022408_37770 [Hymenobacter fastidiosus]|uniref:Uncharacterized protein n=1 Tax=Hymenobacter fastidiosus TaxID=486264 RepID=A0ABP7T327_9BACT
MKLETVSNRLRFEGSENSVRLLLRGVSGPYQHFDYDAIIWTTENPNSRRINWGTEYNVVRSSYVRDLVHVETVLHPITQQILTALSSRWRYVTIVHMYRTCDGYRHHAKWKAGKQISLPLSVS